MMFDGVAKVAAKVAGNPEPPIVHYDPKSLCFRDGKKVFPMQPQHFFTGVHYAMTDLDWKPKVRYGGIYPAGRLRKRFCTHQGWWWIEGRL
mmetsp:Transcript_17583/g.47940  ORF Transcript_17583/g.47940 Transcript_17583/m.47940 type:complete len:91 (-) Transcript_17583:144-416(-)